MSDESIHLHLKVGVPEAQRPAFIALMHELVAQAQQEPGTLMYEWYFGDQQRTCHIHERYLDQAEGDKHVRNFAENYAARFFGCIDGIQAEVFGVASPYMRAVLDGAQPAYFERAAGFNRF